MNEPKPTQARGGTTQKVLLNETCNQRCTFCTARRDVETPALVRNAPQRIETAAGGAKRLVLTGGEPSLRRDLERLIAFARARGSHDTQIWLETNATLLDRARLQRLADAGLDGLRVHMPGVASYAEITGDDQGRPVALAAMREAADIGLALEVSVPLVAANRADADAIPADLVAHGIRPSRIVLVVPRDAPHGAEGSLCDPAQRAGRIVSFDQAARAHDLAVQLAQDSFLPPCLFDQPKRISHLYSLTPGGADRQGYGRQDACDACSVRDRCPGLPDGSGLSPRPIQDERTRRRLSLIGTVDEQVRRELVTHEVGRDQAGNAWPVHTIRLNFRCNQRCDFCFVSTHLPTASHEAIETAIRAAGSEGAAVALSGGEPTLNAKLADYIALAKRSGAREIELQTNATRLGDRALADAVVQAGLDTAFVSLHGSSGGVSDAVTQAPGTFEKTVQGLDMLAKLGVTTRINFVFCESNLHDFPAFVELVARRWPSALLTISFVAPSTDMVPRTRALIPRYSDVYGPLERGLEIARQAGIPVTGFESMCALPVCLKPDGLGDYASLAPIEEGIDDGEFLKPPPCQSCAHEPSCYGIRSGYVAMHGYDELRPVRSGDDR